MIEFYNVRKRTKVKISNDRVEKRTLESKTKKGETRIRYAFASVDDDGTKMIKFCSKTDYDSFK
tara:strand:- start:151 stop:342 length:192 start_codon:yes stop_codon:yes gene_type:complete